MTTTDLTLPVTSSTVFHRPTGEFLDEFAMPASGSMCGVSTNPHNVQKARHRMNDVPTSSSILGILYTRGVRCLSSAIGEDRLGNRSQRQYFVHPTPFDGLMGHAEYHTGRLVLRNGEGPGLLHLEHAVGAVVAHPSQDDPDRILPRIAGSGAEEHVHRGT